MITRISGQSARRRWRLFPMVRRILLLQAAVVIGFPLASWGWLGAEAGRSSALGALVAFIPSLIFASRAGLRVDCLTARQVVRALYGGEVLKLVATGALFAAALHVPGIGILPLMAGYVAVLTVFWFALLVREPISKG